jgi:hypothetical protein
MLPDRGYDLKLEGLPLNDFRNFLEYMYQNKYLFHVVYGTPMTMTVISIKYYGWSVRVT